VPFEKARLATRLIASTSDSINRTHSGDNTKPPRCSHYFAYQLNSKAKSRLATYQCLALVDSNLQEKIQAQHENNQRKQHHALNCQTSRDNSVRECVKQPPHKSARAPTRSDYEILKSKASALASEVEDIT
jgi:hypothetical protein